ncbi:MAG: methyltransferase domain-containing protein, partial [Deltaproteobacteria bacterium]|nr:methyltransferase domain-containing protein [Deltaproteobacteria bacterium]
MSSTLTSVLLETEARYTLIASIAEGRKILDFGCLDARGLSILADAEAAEITVICDDPDSINQQLNTLGVEGVELLLETDDPLPFADQVFDIIICHDPEMRLQKDSERLQELRRILCPSGILIVAIANPNGQTLGDLWGEQHSPSSLTYEEGYARLAPLFGNVSAFGQSPMVASLFYDLNSQEEDPGLLFDRSLADEEELPGWYLLFFGSEPIRRDDLNIVQLPLSELKKYTQQQQLDKTIISSSFENDTVSLATTTENTTEINDLEAAKVLIAQLEIERDELALKNDTALEAQAERVAQLRIEADAKVQPLEAEIASLKHRLATSEVESEELNQRFEQQQQERATALTRISELELALDESKGAVAAKELLEQQAELQRQELEMLREQLVQVENARKELEENITATHGNYNEIETAIANERAERSQLETILNDEREEKANLETELQNEKLAKTNLEAALSNLSDEKTKLETALNNERNINANFEALLNNERIETTNLKNLLIQQEQAAAELQNSLENEINQKQELQNSLENEINQKQELQNSLENEINQKQELQNSLENEINQKQE